MELTRLSAKVRQTEAKEKFVLAAFIGFQLGAGGKQTFGEYLKHLKLSEQPTQSPSSGNDDMALSRMGIKAKKVKK